MPSEERRRWTCPGCQKVYSIKVTGRVPERCPTCRSAEQTVIVTQSPFDDLPVIVTPTHEPLIVRKPSRPIPWRTVALGSGVVASAVFLIAAAAWLLRPPPPAPPKDPEAIARRAVFEAVRPHVLAKLKAPSTAVFSAQPTFERTGEKGFKWQSWVEAKNNFGVPLRDAISAEGKFEEEGIELDFVQLGDAFAYQSPHFKETLEDLTRMMKDAETVRRRVLMRAKAVVEDHIRLSIEAEGKWDVTTEGENWLVTGDAFDSRSKPIRFEVRLRRSDLEEKGFLRLPLK